jgi:hypothetical protein
MVTKNVNRHYNGMQYFKQVISSIYAQASIYHLSADTILAKMAQGVWQDARYNRLPQYRRSYLLGWYDAIYERFMRDHIMGGYVWDGKVYLVPCWDKFPEECRQAIRDNKGPECQLFYADNSVLYT